VDEAQDLDAGAIRLLVQVCAAPNRLFLTADESQSIYAAGFGWSDVHGQLRFVGRTGILRANHRSTRQVAEAARAYLAAGIPEDLQPDTLTHAHAGPFPACRTVPDEDAEADLVARFLRGATRELRLTIGSGAVLVPDQWAGKRLADALEERGVPARYRDSRHFELDDNAVTILPLRAAKGLEFPVVIVAGFLGSRYPQLPDSDEPDAVTEALVRERRTLYVAMTRAMRALLILTPPGARSELFDGFDSSLWNMGTE
jgi:superfamily I DNA/RNA helicase